ncbi:hypothetical protein UFOVP1261_23 [uncultured Caudovirales phage]|uniref:Uncharacterized protein n=1 Tax=uncultured Caudovirales phage TaxID=2100421 RepID=A0A6J5RKW1_9CAUD|nr:hypothetical protein UFOVP1261_23 [uncultured Caudovirales phage]
MSAYVESGAIIIAAGISGIAAVKAAKAAKNTKNVSNGFAAAVLDSLGRIETRLNNHIDHHNDTP